MQVAVYHIGTHDNIGFMVYEKNFIVSLASHCPSHSPRAKLFVARDLYRRTDFRKPCGFCRRTNYSLLRPIVHARGLGPSQTVTGEKATRLFSLPSGQFAIGSNCLMDGDMSCAEVLQGSPEVPSTAASQTRCGFKVSRVDKCPPSRVT